MANKPITVIVTVIKPGKATNRMEQVREEGQPPVISSLYVPAYLNEVLGRRLKITIEPAE